MHAMGECISEHKILKYSRDDFEGMLASLGNLHCERSGEQGSLIQWRVSWNTLDLRLGYMTARQVGQHLIIRFHLMEWDTPRPDESSSPELLTSELSNEGEEWILLGRTGVWSDMMVDEILGAIESDRVTSAPDEMVGKEADQSPGIYGATSPFSQEDIDQQRQLLATHRRTLIHLLTQRAQFSAGHVPAHVAHGIIEARTNIERIKRILRGWDAAMVITEAATIVNSCSIF